MLAKTWYTPKRARVEMVPLIDMFFLLLIFFIFGVFSLRMVEGIVVELPSATTATAEPDEPLTVSVTADGAMFLHQRPVTLGALEPLLRAERAARPGARVVLNVDRRVAHGLVVSVLDTVRTSGLQRVSLQTMAPE